MRLSKHEQISALAGEREEYHYYFTFFKHLSKKTYLDLGPHYIGQGCQTHFH